MLFSLAGVKKSCLLPNGIIVICPSYIKAIYRMSMNALWGKSNQLDRWEYFSCFHVWFYTIYQTGIYFNMDLIIILWWKLNDQTLDMVDSYRVKLLRWLTFEWKFQQIIYTKHAMSQRHWLNLWFLLCWPKNWAYFCLLREIYVAT